MPRIRSTNVEIESLKNRIVQIAEESQPLSVRNLFYQLLTDDGSGAYLAKTENGYQRVVRMKAALCRDKAIPWGYFSDSSRFAFNNDGYCGLGDGDFADRVASLYRRNVWEGSGIYPQLWVESRSIAPTLSGIARQLGVSLYPSGGMSSDSFVHDAAIEAVYSQAETFAVVYVGDYDNAGLDISHSLETKLRYHMADVAGDDWEIPALNFQRVAITAEQITTYRLPTKPAKTTKAGKHQITDTVEAEAMPPDLLRQLVQGAFEPMIDLQMLDTLRTVEVSERKTLKAMLSGMV